MSTQVTILGNTGRDVELRYTPQGTAVANFSVASNTVRNTSRGLQKKTDWFNITAWGKQAETLAKYLQKGSSILVRGKLDLSAWETRDGEPRVNADVTLQDFEFAGVNPAKAVDETVEQLTSEEETVNTMPAIEPAEDAEEKAEMMAALHEMDSLDKAFAGQY
ncbi:MAG TPA: single-stranded DNA-binding protein [Pyrinomonadaceae bacterium]|nr:single-stranded DNA-binding protein [Pyrinomonadaceae bacterium]